MPLAMLSSRPGRENMMTILVNHRAANVDDADWLDLPLVAEMTIFDASPEVFCFFTTDYGRGERLFKLVLEPRNFGNIARAMMYADRDSATAAFSDALSGAYPLSDEMKTVMGIDPDE